MCRELRVRASFSRSKLMPRAEQIQLVFKRTDTQTPQRFYQDAKWCRARAESQPCFFKGTDTESQLFFKGIEAKSRESELPLQRSNLMPSKSLESTLLQRKWCWEPNWVSSSSKELDTQSQLLFFIKEQSDAEQEPRVSSCSSSKEQIPRVSSSSKELKPRAESQCFLFKGANWWQTDAKQELRVSSSSSMEVMPRAKSQLFYFKSTDAESQESALLFWCDAKSLYRNWCRGPRVSSSSSKDLFLFKLLMPRVSALVLQAPDAESQRQVFAYLFLLPNLMEQSCEKSWDLSWGSILIEQSWDQSWASSLTSTLMKKVDTSSTLFWQQLCFHKGGNSWKKSWGATFLSILFAIRIDLMVVVLYLLIWNYTTQRIGHSTRYPVLDDLVPVSRHQPCSVIKLKGEEVKYWYCLIDYLVLYLTLNINLQQMR